MKSRNSTENRAYSREFLQRLLVFIGRMRGFLKIHLQWRRHLLWARIASAYASGEVEDGDSVAGKPTTLPRVKQDMKLFNENIVHYALEKPLQCSIAKHGARADDIDFFLPHYSSAYFRDRTLQGFQHIDFEIPKEKWFTNLAYKGNTDSASTYIMLDEFVRILSHSYYWRSANHGHQRHTARQQR